MRLTTGITAAFIIAMLALPAASVYAQTAGFSESKMTVKEREAICHDGMVPPKKIIGQRLGWRAYQAHSRRLADVAAGHNR